ncbi:MAG: hypothetical protein CTY31_02845 [Hyphomicrobium sp.]|nr:MAG: hypothetical protein CTY39_07165 [Hyphomicrobium sp.]PPD01700.1 MAG: hypothetical protein CTY31_02845 [Hyphomicrobium sp.]
MLNFHVGRLLATTVIMSFASLAPAHAKIACEDGFQRVQGNWLATPYCQDALLGKVARQYGMKASDAHIRNNPNFKRHVCRLVGQDIRVRSTCLEANPYRGRGF